MKQTLLTMVAAAICSLGLFSTAQAQALAPQTDPEITVQSANADYTVMLYCYSTQSQSITLPYPYFYVGSYIYPTSTGGSPTDIKVEATWMSSAPIKISYVGPIFSDQNRTYRLTISAGTAGGSTTTEYVCIITVQPF